MTIDEGQAHGERLCEPNECIVDCCVAMRMVLAQHLSDDTSRLPAGQEVALPAIPATVARDHTPVRRSLPEGFVRGQA